MLTIQFQFPAGRFHATPWGRHVNEGAVEWPPSPWRIFRAWLATGFNKLGWDHVPTAMSSALKKLAEHPPVYGLPPATSSHLRHYMPQYKGSTAKVLDSFAYIARSAENVLVVQWNAELTQQELALLDAVLASLGYLGRAESWVFATRTDTFPPHLTRCEPTDAAPGPGFEPIPLLTLMTEQSYADWRVSAVSNERQRLLSEEQAKAQEKGRKPPIKLKKAHELRIEATYPLNVIEALTMSTRERQDAGWSQPPGTLWSTYWRMTDALSAHPAFATRPMDDEPFFDSALLALTSDTKRQQALPPIRDLIRRAEAIHASLVRFSSDPGPVSSCFTGKDDQDRPLKGHRHASIFPLDLDGDMRIDHIFVYAPMGFDRAAHQALMRIRRTYAKDLPVLYVALAGMGCRKDFEALVPIARTTRHWESVSPFVPPRFMKPKGKDSLLGQVKAELIRRGLPKPSRVEVQVDQEAYVDASDFWPLWRRRTPLVRMVSKPDNPTRSSAVTLAPQWRLFRRKRSKNCPQPPVDAGFGLRISFDEPQRGPIAIGYASHFGLGLMFPCCALPFLD